MTGKAVVHGDFHASTKDSKNLLDRDTTTIDALVLEGRSDSIQLNEHSVGYFLWLIGYFSLELIYVTSDWARRILPGNGWDAREEAKSRDLVVEDEIDAELHEVWSLAKGPTRRRLYYLSLMLAAFVLINPFLGAPVFGIPEEFTSVLLAWLIPLGYSAGVVILALARDGVRDDIMSESIVELSETKGYDEILVLCGQAHVAGISDRLEEEGWDVERKDSVHLLSTAGSWI